MLYSIFFNFLIKKKELLQNAEDSNASVCKFFIDRTEYPKNDLIYSGLAKFQVITF